MCALRAEGGSLLVNQRFNTVVGTLGCVVRSRDDASLRYVLSAAHVMNPGGYASAGDAIQALIDNRYETIAVLEDWTPLRDVNAGSNACDAAIARIIRPDLVSASVGGRGAPRGLIAAVPGTPLRLSGGRTSREIDAVVLTVDQSVPVIYEDGLPDAGVFTLPFTGQLLYGRDLGSAGVATQPGDSGALVLDRNHFAVGLHIARTPDSYSVAASVCTPLALILEYFKVDLVTDADAGAASASAVAAAPAAVAAPPPVDADTLSQRAFQSFGLTIGSQLQPHNVYGGSSWLLRADGLAVDGVVAGSGGALVTVPRVLTEFRDEIFFAAKFYRVPVELIVATICTESSGDRNVPSRPESEGRLSAGLMQTLIGTAQDMLPGEFVDEAFLKRPANSIRAGTAYIRSQSGETRFDPPLVACAYNAGRVHPNASAFNRWRMVQFPIDTGRHADRFVAWFNDCFAVFTAAPGRLTADVPSLWRLFRG